MEPGYIILAKEADDYAVLSESGCPIQPLGIGSLKDFWVARMSSGYCYKHSVGGIELGEARVSRKFPEIATAVRMDRHKFRPPGVPQQPLKKDISGTLGLVRPGVMEVFT
jgi:hypothetical protein